MPIKVKPGDRESVAGMVRAMSSVEEIQKRLLSSDFSWGVMSDMMHFHRQLALTSVRPVVASLKDSSGDVPSRIPVLIQIPDLDNPEASRDALISMLQKSHIDVEMVDRYQAEVTFIDRLAEFLAVQQAPPAPPVAAPVPPAPTQVTSKRAGDMLLYAKGYFISTGTAFGASTATVNLSGRYSFGIVDAGTHKFDDVVWSCPSANPVLVDKP